ncbi:hypothetical protein [Tenacibaculum insulae]|uniref:hypothetical protein n=1 Tax=Tenacibaculum insulae TaxID=2029677 RepID=UPI003AB5E92D
MKKLLCIALFSIAMVVNATESKKEVEVKNTTELQVEKNLLENNQSSNNEVYVVQGCGERANLEYDKWREAGFTHREARSLRRDWVRGCRGGALAWLDVGVWIWGTEGL